MIGGSLYSQVSKNETTSTQKNVAQQTNTEQSVSQHKNSVAKTTQVEVSINRCPDGDYGNNPRNHLEGVVNVDLCQAMHSLKNSNESALLDEFAQSVNSPKLEEEPQR